MYLFTSADLPLFRLPRMPWEMTEGNTTPWGQVRVTTAYNISDNSQTELQHNLLVPPSIRLLWRRSPKKKKKWKPHWKTLLVSPVWAPGWICSGSTPGCWQYLLEREKERQRQSVSEAETQRDSSVPSCAVKRAAIITALWESHKSRRRYVTARRKNTCGLARSS